MGPSTCPVAERTRLRDKRESEWLRDPQRAATLHRSDHQARPFARGTDEPDCPDAAIDPGSSTASLIDDSDGTVTGATGLNPLETSAPEQSTSGLLFAMLGAWIGMSRQYRAWGRGSSGAREARPQIWPSSTVRGH